MRRFLILLFGIITSACAPASPGSARRFGLTQLNINVPWINALDGVGSDLGAQIMDIDGALGSTCGTITVPPGDYNITTPIILSACRVLHLSAGNYHFATTGSSGESIAFRDNTTIEGDGSVTALYESTTGAVRSWTILTAYNNSGYSGLVGSQPGSTNVSIKHMRFVKAAPTLSPSFAVTVNLGNSTRVLVEDVIFDHTSAEGLQIGGSSVGAGGYVQGVGGTFTGLYGTRLNLSVDGFATLSIAFDPSCTSAAATVTFLNNWFTNFFKSGATASLVNGQIRITSASVGSTSTVNVIQANAAAGFPNTGLGTPGTGGFKASYITFSDSICDGPTSHCFAITNGENIQVTRNKFKVGSHQGVADLEVNTPTDAVRNFVISDNVIDMRGASIGGGIGLSAGGTKAGPGVISNNTFMGEDINSPAFNYSIAETAIAISRFNDILVANNNMQGLWGQTAFYTDRAQRITVVGNRIQASNVPAMRIGDSQYCTFINNAIYSPPKQGVITGSSNIVETHASGTASDYNYYAGNYLEQPSDNYAQAAPLITLLGSHSKTVGNSIGNNPNPPRVVLSASGTLVGCPGYVAVLAAQNTVNVTLPDPALAGAGCSFPVQNEDGGTANHPFSLVAPTGSSVNGQASVVSSTTPYTGMRVSSNGVGWFAN